MGNEVDYKKFTWVIKDFSSLQSTKIYSDEFVADGCKWRLLALPKGNDVEYLSLYLDVAGTEFLPDGWRRYVDYRFTLVNHLSEAHTVHKKGWRWFDKNTRFCGFRDMVPVSSLIAINGGFLLNGEITIIAEVGVLEVIDTLSASQVEEISTDRSEQRAHDDSSSSEDLQNKDDVTIEVNGFQVLVSQVDVVKTLFEKHPDLAQGFSLKNQHIKNAYMNALLDLIKTLCKAAKDLSVKDLKKADDTLSDLIKVGWNLEWLRMKLDQALEKQVEYDTRIRELEKQVKKRKLALEEIETDLEKEKAAASASLMSLD
ncbi:PREDICTED: MATH domain and coiled-coil domain-containing protein At3g58280-like [Camelina sativa]|uniref:MATH domain and coiled-coil domain-containing protein At3g58280-like n=1 Tax=Camelina sativa TaxID=90675 RepID=A0ABM0TKI0_CAMSA|nr:PREDICTED: MATH domain and coiled-coil domain-containing protein At3g58280-like [Camelina sativa]XP_010427738.1 PREDICTED: MATH domain and coiled-coil domain-containing protein At3g58280-like [Camelina sativa]